MRCRSLRTLRTAWSASHHIRARRLGFDPSGQEEATPVYHDLQSAHERLQRALLHLRTRTAVGIREDQHAALVQAFEDRLALADLADELRVVHQKLLSLFPDVDAALIEAVRVQAQQATEATDAEHLERTHAILLPALAATVEALREALIEGA